MTLTEGQKRMQLSFIIPVYNTKAYLRRCIESILDAGYSDREIVLVDDGSTDGSGAICDEYADEYAFVKVFHLENGGVSKARNFGLTHASGRYVYFMDSDDYLEKEGLSFIMGELIRHPDAQMACFGFTKILRGGKTKMSVMPTDGEEVLDSEGKDLYYRMLNGPGYVFNKIFMKSLLRDVEFDSNLRYGEDTMFVLQAVERCKKALIFKTMLYCYDCEREGNVTSSALDERSLDYLSANRKIFEKLRMTYPTIGVSRCFVAAKTVLGKMTKGKNQDIYYGQIKKTLRFRPREIRAYLKDGKLRETKKQKLESLGVLLFPRCIVMMKGRKN